MKKNILLMAAASALMLTACTSEDDLLQTGQQKQVTPQEVGFDVYTTAATTRAGLTGTMTTNRMQRSEGEGGGFGVYAFLTEDSKAGAGDAAANADGYTPAAGNKPNFMFNEKILWNNTNLGWYYSPLKYWPNETDKDSQADPASMEGTTPVHLDRLTFFAYAPYVSDGSGTTGITAISNNLGMLSGNNVTDPTIAYVSTNTVADVEPNNYVDLLWGVAPSGGLEYTAVNGTTVTVKEGTPLIDMIKPDVNTNMKFLFNHALARFGVSVVAAIDQVSPGGELDPNTKITINSFKITGPFGIGGELNLNNGVNANIANWTKITGGTAEEPIDGSTANLSADKSITVSTAIADNLKWAGPHTWGSYATQGVVGVTSAKQDLLDPSTKWFTKLAAAPTYNVGKKYYTDPNGKTPAVATYKTKAGEYYTHDGTKYVAVAADATINAPEYPKDYIATTYYTVEEGATIYNSANTYTDDALPATTQLYQRSGDGSEADPYIYTSKGTKSDITWESGTTNYYTLTGTKVSVRDIKFAYAPATESLSYYEAERNYLYVVPTNNVSKNTAAAANEEDLRTITVQIEYYITTEDSKVQGGRTQIRNVVTKKVVLPSLANSKSYNLNLVLGLTSVKIEAEVDDWKVVNGQVDLPQNTAE